MPVVHEEPVVIQYSDYGNALTVVVYYLMIAIVVVLSFILVWISENFWLRSTFVMERPAVTFSNKIYLEVILKQKGSDDLVQKLWTSNAAINDMLGERLVFPQFSLSSFSLSDLYREHNPLDDTYNNIDPSLVQLFKVRFDVPLEQNQEVAAFRVVMFFDFKLQRQRKIRVEALADFEQQFVVPTEEITFYGDLKFKQNIPFRRAGTKNKPIYQAKLIDFDSITGLDELKIDQVVADVANGRELTATVVDVKKWWKPKISSLSPTSDKSFSASAEINIPVQQIIYEPAILQVLKHAWIQYLSIVLVLGLIGKSGFRFLIMSGLLPTRMQRAPRK